MTSPGRAQGRKRPSRLSLGGAACRRFLALCVFFLLPLPAAGAVSVNYSQLGHGPNNPRFFVHAPELARIRSLIATPGTQNKTLYDQWKAHADYWLGRNDPLGTNYMTAMYLDDIAALYLLTQQPSYGDAAARLAVWLVGQGSELSHSGSAPARVSSVALAYDWCYDRFTDAQKTTVRNALALAAQNNRSTWHHHYYYHASACWDLAMAAVEDAPTYGAITNAQLRGYFEEYLNEFKDGFCACLDVLTPQAYVEYYPANSQGHAMMFVRSIAGYINWDPMSSVWVSNIPKTWNARFRPDYEWSRMLSKYNYSDANPYWWFAVLGSRWNDQVSQAIIERIDDNYGAFAPNSGPFSGNDLYMYFFFHDPAAPAASLASLQPTQMDYYDPGAGVYLGRTGYNFGSAASDITLGFFCGPFNFPTSSSGVSGYNMRSIGHFFIARGDDGLLQGSGGYYNELDAHFAEYYNNTIGNNTLLVFSPSQSVRSWNDCHGHPSTFSAPRMGGQEYGNRTIGAARWPQCADAAGPGYNGEITKYVSNDDYVMIEADMTEVYKPRATSVHRRWLYVRPNWVLLQDRVVLRAGATSDTIRTIFHCVDRPVVDGDSSLVLGAFPTGGVFRKVNATRAIINREESSARLYFLGAQGGDRTEVRVIGGKNTANQGWQQDFDPYMGDDPYNAYSPGNTSFEFWADGKNYVPTGAGCVVTPDMYAERNTAPRAGGRESNPACDWRIEYQTRPTGSVVSLASLIHVTQSGTPVRPVTIAASGDTLRVGFTNDAGQQMSIALCPLGIECQSLTW